jgi:choline dehydrogenase
LEPDDPYSGRHGKLFGPGVSWRLKTVSQKNLDTREIWYPQGKTLGGSGSINAMIYIRGQREDCDNWAALGNDGWAYCAFQGLRARLPAKGSAPQSGFQRRDAAWRWPHQVTRRDGRRRSSAVSYLHPVRSRKNLTVMTGARAIRIVMEGTRAVGLEVAQGRSDQIFRADREAIVTSGALNLSRLLMLSGIGNADELKPLGIKPQVDLKGVGKNLQDHLCSNVHVSLKEPISYDGQDR